MNRISCYKRIQEAMLKRNIKQVELCQLTGIPKSAMSQYINGKFEPKQDRVYLIANALNVSEVWLMGYDVPMEKETNSPEKSEELEEGIILHRNGKTSTYRLSKEKLKTIQSLLDQLNDEDDEDDL